MKDNHDISAMKLDEIVKAIDQLDHFSHNANELCNRDQRTDSPE